MFTPPITIRDATLDDLDFLRKMVWEGLMASPTFVAWMGLATIQEYEDRYWKTWAKQPSPAFIAVDADGRSLGALSLRPNDTEPPGWRIAIGVEAEARGQGVGRKLMERALDYAKTDGVAYVNLHVDPANQVAITLYQRMGFVDVERRDESIEMRIELT